MIVDALRLGGDGPGAERSARLRWEGGEHRIRIAADRELLAPEEDASPYLPATLLLAMQLGEDVEIDGLVSPRLLAASERVQGIYHGWEPSLRRVQVRASGEAPVRDPGERTAAFFSRGVDSTYTAAREREELGALLFCDGLEPAHDERVRAEEQRLAAGAAEELGLPLVTAWTNLRELTDPLRPEWEDLTGAGLAFIALSLGGALGRAVIPSSDSWATLEPCGTSPVLDPQFSTEWTAIEHHAGPEGRVEKVAWLAARRPAALRLLKVCFYENRPDNCGRCGKCLLTMAALLAAGALDRAEGFPDELDPSAVEAHRIPGFQPGYEWSQVCRALPETGHTGRVRRAALRSLERSAWESSAGRPPATGFRGRRSRVLRALIREGRPWPPAGSGPPASVVGLVRGLDRAAGRHRYRVGGLPECEVVGELGALRTDPDEASVPLFVGDDGRVATRDYHPQREAPTPALVLRWIAAPLSWRHFAPLRTRAAATLRRALELPRLARRRPDAAPAAAEPAGWLHAQERPRLRPLYAGEHPVTGDQLLSCSRWEANDMGYVRITLLGWLEPRAPVTGRLGTRRPHLPWASRFGQWRRDA